MALRSSLLRGRDHDGAGWGARVGRGISEVSRAGGGGPGRGEAGVAATPPWLALCASARRGSLTLGRRSLLRLPDRIRGTNISYS